MFDAEGAAGDGGGEFRRGAARWRHRQLLYPKPFSSAPGARARRR